MHKSTQMCLHLVTLRPTSLRWISLCVSVYLCVKVTTPDLSMRPCLESSQNPQNHFQKSGTSSLGRSKRHWKLTVWYLRFAVQPLSFAHPLFACDYLLELWWTHAAYTRWTSNPEQSWRIGKSGQLDEAAASHALTIFGLLVSTNRLLVATNSVLKSTVSGH